MKKRNVDTEKVVLHPSEAIAGAGCGCPAGVDGRCNHLAATLFAIEAQWNFVPCDTDSAVSSNRSLYHAPTNHASGIQKRAVFAMIAGRTTSDPRVFVTDTSFPFR